MPTLGPKNTQLRQVKNTGDFDVSIRFNKYGLRDAKGLDQAKPSDYFLVGDSLMFGWGVEENQRLSEVLQGRIQTPVFNLGIPADIDGYRKLIDYANGFGARVKNLVLVISEETNLKDYEKNQAPVPRNRKGFGLFQPIKSYLMTHSALYFLITSFIHKSPMLKDIAVSIGLIVPNLEGIAQRPYVRKVLVSSANRTAKLAENFQTIIAVAPSRAIWHGSDRDKAVADRIHSELIQLLRERGLSVIDLKEIFEMDGKPLQHFFKNDGHWNPNGHAAAAEAVAKSINAN